MASPAVTAAHVFVFGKQVAAAPEKVVRMLKNFDAERGLYYLPPYDDRNVASKHLIVLNVDGPGGFFAPCGVRPAIADKYLPTAMLQHRERYQRTEWAQAGLFGKPDVVPSSIKHLRDLRNLQMTVYAEIVRDERTLDYFDDFVAEWTERGGAEMTQEAREIYKVREEIYRKVGVVQRFTGR